MKKDESDDEKVKTEKEDEKTTTKMEQDDDERHGLDEEMRVPDTESSKTKKEKKKKDKKVKEKGDKEKKHHKKEHGKIAIVYSAWAGLSFSPFDLVPWGVVSPMACQSHRLPEPPASRGNLSKCGKGSRGKLCSGRCHLGSQG